MGRECFWGAVLILSSVFGAPLSFVPFSIFYFLLRQMKDRGVLPSEDDGEFPSGENVSCSGTFMHLLLILQLQMEAPDKLN